MGLIYRGETRFDLKGAIPVKLPLLLRGESLISILAEAKYPKNKRLPRYIASIEQFAFLSSGFCTLRRTDIAPSDNKAMGLEVLPQSFLRIVPRQSLVYRTMITVSVLSTVDPNAPFILSL